MSLHESIVADINAAIEALGDVDAISPDTLADAVQRQYEIGGVDPRITYTSREHLKQMSRRALARRYDADSDESEAIQGDMFSGRLQRRYPTPHKQGEPPTYKLLEALTEQEIQWNETTLERSADARLMHLRALRAYRLSRASLAA